MEIFQEMASKKGKYVKMCQKLQKQQSYSKF